MYSRNYHYIEDAGPDFEELANERLVELITDFDHFNNIIADALVDHDDEHFRVFRDLFEHWDNACPVDDPDKHMQASALLGEFVGKTVLAYLTNAAKNWAEDYPARAAEAAEDAQAAAADAAYERMKERKLLGEDY
jgi:hypothetical protein